MPGRKCLSGFVVMVNIKFPGSEGAMEPAEETEEGGKAEVYKMYLWTRPASTWAVEEVYDSTATETLSRPGVHQPTLCLSKKPSPLESVVPCAPQGLPAQQSLPAGSRGVHESHGDL